MSKTIQHNANRSVSIIKIIISTFLIILILRNVQLSEVWAIVINSKLDLLGIVFIIKILSFVISAYKWLLLTRIQGITKNFNELHTLYYIGFFFNNFLPTTIGGDVIRINKASEGNETRIGVAASVVAERLLGLLALLLIACVGFIINLWRGKIIGFNETIVVLITLFTVIILTGLVYIYFKNNRKQYYGIVLWMRNIFLSLIDRLWIFKGEYGVIILVLNYSIAFQFLIVVNVYLIAISIGVYPDIIDLILVVPLVMLISMIPISINGFGLKEGAFIIFFQSINISIESALVIALITRSFDIILSLVGGFAFMLEGVKRPSTTKL
jgi:glycosyltransferase 2 family protein